MPDWFPWALLAAVYLLAGATCARHLCLLDDIASALAPVVGKKYMPGSMKRVWPVVLLVWPCLFWISFP